MDGHGTAHSAKADFDWAAAVVDSSQDAIITFDLELRCTGWNAGSQALLGYRADEMLGRVDGVFVGPQHSESDARLRARAVAGETFGDLETRRIHKDGSIVDVALRMFPLHDQSGTIIGAAIVARDITATRRMQATLNLHAELLDHVDAGVIATDDSFRIIKWNRGARRLFGSPAAQAMGRPAAELLVPGAARNELGDASRSPGQSVPVVYEQEIEREDGTRVPVMVRWAPITYGPGLQGFVGISVDVSERRQAEAALAQAQARFRYAFEDSPLGMVMLDLSGRFERANAAFCKLVGRSCEQLEGVRVDSIIHPDDVDDMRERHRALLAGESSSYFAELRYVHDAGFTITVATHASLLRSPDGTPLNVLAHVQDVTDRKRHELQLEYLADHDALTGLLNRRAFNRALRSHAALAERYGAVGSVLVIDLDEFKFVNDTLGHHAGDELITRTAQLLARRLRASDVLARLGGDEFGVLLPQSDPGAAADVAANLLGALRAERISIGGLERKVTASIGIAVFEDGKLHGGEDVLVNADLAMYDAKEAGRDRFAVFSTGEQTPSPTKGRITWAHRIQAALALERFTLLAQPIVELATGAVTQYEMLLRMRDEHGGLIPPGAFLCVAERLDLIGQVDAWVISNSISMLAELGDAADAPALEINLSGASIGNSKLLEHIEHELAVYEVDPARVIFEITETAALGSIPKAKLFGDRLSEIGCRFALDDFGAGFGSFYYLKHLRFDLIKIDGEFVRDCRSSKTDQLLIAAIVDIARGLGTETVAEFVPDDETIALLAELGVDYGQGYHLGMPAPLTGQLAANRAG